MEQISSFAGFPCEASSEDAVGTLIASWPRLSGMEKLRTLRNLPAEQGISLFRHIEARDQADLLGRLRDEERPPFLRCLDVSALASLARFWPEEWQAERLEPLDQDVREKVLQFLAETRGTAAGLIRSGFASLAPDLLAEQAIQHFREQANRDTRNIYYAYVLDAERRLVGVVPFRQLFVCAPGKKVRDIMRKDVLSVRETAPEEEVANLFAQHGLMALPVVDVEGRMRGIVTAENIVSKVQDEATEDIQKLGGMEALDAPYWDIGFFRMVRKRAGWLMALFIGEMFTATAMGYYENEIARAVVLALFIPLIISSGGNSGSQATTLIIRAMALQQVRLRDWWRVLLRELGSGLALGLILGSIGLCRILFWPARKTLYGEHYGLIALAVSVSLVGIVVWGTLMGSMLPFLLRRLGFDPASASAPFVATLVDVTGLVIYFSVASSILSGTLL